MVNHKSRSARTLLIANFAIFLGYGIAAVLFPAKLAQLTDVQLPTTTALADLRALYGGLSLAIAALFLQALRDPRWVAPAVFMAIAASLGPASARLYSSAVSGVPNELVLGFLVAELGGALWAFVTYRALGSPSLQGHSTARALSPEP
jgi:hypothetical protein